MQRGTRVPVALVYVGPRDESREEEFRVLAETLNYEVRYYLKWYRRPQTPLVLGRGKVEELRKVVQELGLQKVIFYPQLKPSQVYRLTRELGVEVLDRIQLVLEIFAMRAGSREAKLQIELAKLRYELPLIREKIRRAKLGELPGYHGGGRYDFDAYYRHVISRISRIEEELEKLRRRKELHRRRRRRTGIPVIAITGYTCAGKTTLFNLLTREEKLVDDKPFATLTSYVRRATVLGHPVLFVDTIGFLQDLPPLLIEAFYATLEDIVESDIVLLVADASEPLPRLERKLETSVQVLTEIGAVTKPILCLLNKIDKLSEDVDLSELVEYVRSRYPEFSEVIPISALRGTNIDLLLETIVKYLPQNQQSTGVEKCRV